MGTFPVDPLDPQDTVDLIGALFLNVKLDLDKFILLTPFYVHVLSECLVHKVVNREWA